MKFFSTFFLCGILLSATAFADAPIKKPEKKFPQSGHRAGNRHPLLSALESKDFSDAERAELKQLAAKDPRAFEQRMRKHFFKRRQEKAKQMLALRSAYLEAKTPEMKEAALKKIKDEMRKEVDNHLKFQKKVLDDTETAIRNMQKRLDAMKQRYEKQAAGKEAFLERRAKELLAENPPERLLKDAAGDFSRPHKKMMKKP